MGTTTYNNWGQSGNSEQFHLQKELLKRAGAHECLDLAFDKKTIAKKMGRSVAMQRWDVPAVNATPLAESQNPAERQMVPSTYYGTLASYGDTFNITREQMDLDPIDALRVAAENGIELVKSTRERVRWIASYGGSGVYYNSSAISSRNTVNGVFTAGRFQRAIRDLKNAKGKVFTSMVGGAAKDNTYPIEPAYLCFCSTDLQTDLRNNLPGFRTVDQYASGKAISEHEFGAWQNVRFITSQELIPFANAGASLGGGNFISTGGSNIDVYPMVIFAKDAICSVGLKGNGPGGSGNLRPTVLNKADKSDPANRLCKVSFFWYDLVMRVNESWMVRIETACTNNPT